MKRIYAPWRHTYVTKSTKQKKEKTLLNNCVFCDQFAQQQDETFYILKRFENTAVIMNLYPYNGGHVMIIPFKHIGNLQDLGSTIRQELMEVTNTTAEIIKQVTNCEGLNIGLNLGKAGGGGIQEHLHMHVLPRWSGDTNFLATLTDTSLICTDFNEVYQELRQAFNKLP